MLPAWMPHGRRLTNCDEALNTDTNTSDTSGAFGFVGEDATLMATFIPMLVVCAALVLLYLIILPIFKNIFYTNPMRRHTGPPVPSGRFHSVSVFRIVALMSDDELEEYAGLDGLVMMLIIRMTIRIFLGLIIIGLFLALMYVTAYYTADEDDQATYPEGGLAKISLANVVFETGEGGSPGAYAAIAFSVVGGYLITGWVCYNLSKVWREVIRRRVRDFADHTVLNSRVVLVRNPLTHPCVSTAAARALWHKMYPGEVLDVCMLRDTGRLPDLFRKHDKLTRRVDHLASDDAENISPKNTRKNSTEIHEKIENDEEIENDANVEADEEYDKIQKYKNHEKSAKRSGCCCARTNKGELLHKKQAELRKVDTAMVKEHKRRLATDEGLNYLVLFRSYRAANTAKQVRMGGKGADSVVAAPLPEDINHNTLEPDEAKANKAKKTVGVLTFWALFFFYLVPIGAISFLISFENNEWMADAIEDLSPEIQALIEGLLPGLVLIVFLAILPDICLFLAQLQCPYAKSKVILLTFIMLFRFNVVWNFIGIALGSSALVLVSLTECLVREPADVLTSIGSQLAKNSTFFVVVVILNMFLSLPLIELTLSVLISKEKFLKLFGILRKAEIPREMMRYHSTVSKLMFISLIGIAYAAISPIVIPFVLFFCCEAYLLYGRNLVFFHARRPPGQGNLWPEVSCQFYWILVLSHIMLFAVHAVIQSIGAVFIVPLPFLVYLFRLYVNRAYAPQLSVLSLQAAVQADDDTGSIDDGEAIRLFQEAYAQPEWELPEDLMLGPSLKPDVSSSAPSL